MPKKFKKRIEPTWRSKDIIVRKFVDDNIKVEKLDMMAQPSFEQYETVFKNPRVFKSENMFKHITKKAKNAGLVVNAKKTNLLVMSASKSYEARAHFYDEDSQRVDSTDSLKTLGFIFNQKANAEAQVEKLCTKFRQKVWAIRRMRKVGFTEQELVKLYTSYIRPSIEYSSPIYDSMLTAEQSETIEKQQYFALKNIFGFEYSHSRLLELSGLKTLKERRRTATLKFAQKTLNNPRFQHWFPKRRMTGRNSHKEEIIENSARTDRRRNSPIYHYRRILNDHRIEYDVRKNLNPAPSTT